MKSKILSVCLLGAALNFTSCNDFLDMTPSDGPTDKIVWSKVEYAELAINNFYHYINYFGSFNTGQCSAGMTEGLTELFKYGSTTYNAYMYIPNEIAYGGSVLSANYAASYLGNWSDAYEYVRRVNEGIYNMKKYSSFDSETSNRLLAEMRFFRGMLYFDLVKRYKEVIIYDEDLDKIQKDKALSSEAEGWDFVQKDLEFAGEHLPVDKISNGRLTSGAAYGLLSRAMLYAERWDVVKNASEKVMAMGYELESSYADAFKSANKEAILQYSFDKSGVTHGFDNYYAPGGDRALNGNDMTGGYGTPTQEMVESYELAQTGGFPDWTEWHNPEGTRETPPYQLLEERFHATVLYNGSVWKGRTVEPFIGGTDGWCTWKVDPTPDGRTTTGYYLRKMVDESHDFSEFTKCTQPWIAIRYAEVLLNYAEACYHTNDPSSANAKINELRGRVNLPEIKKSGDELMAAIRQERKVELAYEGFYYWDMKRWKLAETAFSGNRTHGLKVEKVGGAFKYSYVECDTENRNFPAKMYRIPLPQSELSNNALVSQYPEWN